MAQSSRISEYEQSAGEGVQMAQGWANEMVDTQPVATICTVFAAGVVVGLGAVAILAASTSPPRSRLSQMEGFSQRMADAICNAMPHQLADLWQK